MKLNKLLISIAPVSMITIAAMVVVILAIVSILLAMRGPWIGIVFDRTYSGKGVRIEQVKEESPAAGKLFSGDIITALVTKKHGKIDVFSSATMDDPDQFSSYVRYNDFFTHQQALWEVIASPSFTAILSDERKIRISPVRFPGVKALPVEFWLLLFFGGTCFLIGVSVWSMRLREPVTRVLVVSGTGYMFGAYSCAIYLVREFAMPAKLFFGLSALNHLGIMIFAYSAILFFWYYPRKLGNGPAAAIFVIGVSALWLNETMQWLSWPAHVYYAHFVVAYCLLVVFAMFQWRKSKDMPRERAMLKWLLSTMILSLGFTIALFYMPIIVRGYPIASTVPTFGAVFGFYLGLIIGIIRFHQFDMEHWWITAWQWLMFILITLCSDALFVYFLQLNEVASIAFSFTIGSVYLMLRQWFWGRYSGKNRRAIDYALPHLVDALVLQKQPDQQWLHLVDRVFNPLTVKMYPGRLETTIVERGGLILQLPSLDGLATIEVFCCDQGKRMFSSEDIKLARLLLELMRHSRDISTAHEQGVQEERYRIQKDLHDDVAARLLSLLHQTREPLISKVASNALRGLRDVIHLLGAEEALLEDVMTDIEAGAREQLSGLGIHFKWKSPDNWPGIMLSSQQHINLRRIARETIANALKHATPKNIIIEASLEFKEFFLRISNDDVNVEPSRWIAGRGLNNIKSRVAEMAGSHEWGIEQKEDNQRYCHLAVKIPLSAGL